MQDLYSHQAIVEEYLSQTATDLSAHSFRNLAMWQDFFHFTVEIIYGNLCVFAQDQAGMFMYWPPLGPSIHRQTIPECFKKMQAVNHGNGVSRIEHVLESQLSSFPKEEYQIFEKGVEYVYDRQPLVDLKGGEYKSKRNAYHYFLKHYQVRYRPFTIQDRAACCALYERWAVVKKQQSQDEMFQFMLEDNRIVHERVMNEYAQLGMVGRVVECEGQVVGYTFGYFLKPDYFCDVVEIADRQYKGIAVYLFAELCKDAALAQVKRINVMDDFAMDNLKKTKLSYRPIATIPSFVVSCKDSHGT